MILVEVISSIQVSQIHLLILHQKSFIMVFMRETQDLNLG